MENQELYWGMSHPSKRVNQPAFEYFVTRWITKPEEVSKNDVEEYYESNKLLHDMVPYERYCTFGFAALLKIVRENPEVQSNKFQILFPMLTRSQKAELALAKLVHLSKFPELSAQQQDEYDFCLIILRMYGKHIPLLVIKELNNGLYPVFWDVVLNKKTNSKDVAQALFDSILKNNSVLGQRILDELYVWSLAEKGQGMFCAQQIATVQRMMDDRNDLFFDNLLADYQVLFLKADAEALKKNVRLSLQNLLSLFDRQSASFFEIFNALIEAKVDEDKEKDGILRDYLCCVRYYPGAKHREMWPSIRKLVQKRPEYSGEFYHFIASDLNLFNEDHGIKIDRFHWEMKSYAEFDAVQKECYGLLFDLAEKVEDVRSKIAVFRQYLDWLSVSKKKEQAKIVRRIQKLFKGKMIVDKNLADFYWFNLLMDNLISEPFTPARRDAIAVFLNKLMSENILSEYVHLTVQEVAGAAEIDLTDALAKNAELKQTKAAKEAQKSAENKKIREFLKALNES